MRTLSPLLSKAAIDPCHRKAPELFPNEVVALYRRALSKWDAVQWGKGIRDVQYFLINSMEEELLAENEHALIAHYVAELRRRGVVLSEATAWADYRALSFQTLMTSVVSIGLGTIGLGTMTDMDEVLRVLLGRSVAAIRRTNFAAWLAQM